MTGFDVAKVRGDFPILGREINGNPLVYLDSANTSQKPVQVLDVMRAHQERYNGNVSRSVHTLGTELVHGPGDVRVVLQVVVLDRLDHLARLLRGVRRVQVDQREPARELTGQDREVRPDRLQVQGTAERPGVGHFAPALTNRS